MLYLVTKALQAPAVSLLMTCMKSEFDPFNTDVGTPLHVVHASISVH